MWRGAVDHGLNPVGGEPMLHRRHEFGNPRIGIRGAAQQKFPAYFDHSTVKIGRLEGDGSEITAAICAAGIDCYPVSKSRPRVIEVRSAQKPEGEG